MTALQVVAKTFGVLAASARFSCEPLLSSNARNAKDFRRTPEGRCLRPGGGNASSAAPLYPFLHSCHFVWIFLECDDDLLARRNGLRHDPARRRCCLRSVLTTGAGRERLVITQC